LVLTTSNRFLLFQLLILIFHLLLPQQDKMYISTSVLIIFALLPSLGMSAPAAGFGGKGNGNNDVKKNTAAVTAAAATAKSSAVTSLASMAGASMTGNETPDSTNSTGASGVSDKQVANAVVGWMTDTGKVTRFLNTATSLTGDEFTKQATIAFNADVDELNHKAVLDVALDPATIQAANDTLATQGNFQAVVDSLQAMVNEGPDTAQARVDEINNNRCVNVLPNINMYFAAAGSPDSSAFVPTGCLEVAVTNPGGVAPNTQILPSVTRAPDSVATSSSAPNNAANAPVPTSSVSKNGANPPTRASSSAASNARANTTKRASASKSSPTVK
jgi:hypothetical protein